DLKMVTVGGVEAKPREWKAASIYHGNGLGFVKEIMGFYTLGWSVKGCNACLICMNETSSSYLSHSRKVCYMGHRRCLPSSHQWRNDKKNFDGTRETTKLIIPMSGLEILHDIDCTISEPCCSVKKRKRKNLEGNKGWKKSIFFKLEYWAKLKLRHNIDIMHVVKNVTESLTGTLFNIKGKTKDTWKSRKDLMDKGFKKSLHLVEDGNSFIMPMACYHFTKDEKQKVLSFLTSIKFP
ncbi:transposon protein, CACTA, En/Spm sub-class, partial [Tanacetum coccineum]